MEEKVDRLEILFGYFMVQTTASLHRIDRSIEKMEQTVERMEREGEKERRESAEQRERDQREWNQRWEEMKKESAEQRERDQREWNERWEQLGKEREREQREWNQRWEQMKKESAEQRESDRREWNERWKQLAKERKREQREWNKRWGDLANRMGTIVEDIVAPNMPRIAKTYFGIGTINDFMVRRWVRSPIDPSKRREFDVIVVGNDRVLINETKGHVRIEYIDRFIAALAEIELYFPEYRGKTIIPVFASLYLSEDIVNYLSKNKLYAMGMGDQTMELLNWDKIQANTD